MSHIEDKKRTHTVTTYATEEEMSKLRKKTGQKYNYAALGMLIQGVVNGTIKIPKPEEGGEPNEVC